MAYATQTMRNAADEFENKIASAVCSGIVGDSRHNYGYHRSAAEVSASDYSRQLDGDKNGIDWDAADAIDMSMNTADMKVVTRRFYDSWKSTTDLRLNYFREIIGTLDGVNVIYMDTQSGNQGSSDSSHLWHLHSGGMRCYVNNPYAWKAWVSVAVGESWDSYKSNNPGDPMTKETPASVSPPQAPPFPLPSGHVYGLITGPSWMHGGYNSSERPAVKAIQQKLIAKGVVGGVTNVNSGWADGKYERETFNAVWEFQKRNGLQVDGSVGPNTWRILMR